MRFKNRRGGIVGEMERGGSEIATDDNGALRGIKKTERIGMTFVTKTNKRTSRWRNF